MRVTVAAPRAQGVEVAGGIDDGSGVVDPSRVGSFEQTHHLVFGDHRAPPFGAAGVEVGRDWSRSYSRARLRRARCSRCLAVSGSIPSTAATSATEQLLPRHQAQHLGVGVTEPGQRGEDETVTRRRRPPTSSAAAAGRTHDRPQAVLRAGAAGPCCATGVRSPGRRPRTSTPAPPRRRALRRGGATR